MISKHYNDFNGQYSPVPIVSQTFLMIELRCNHKKSLFSSIQLQYYLIEVFLGKVWIFFLEVLFLI